jgi:hypothetical protein
VEGLSVSHSNSAGPWFGPADDDEDTGCLDALAYRVDRSLPRAQARHYLDLPEPTEEDWQDFAIWLARVNAGLPPALPEEPDEVEAEEAAAVEQPLRPHASEEPPW